MIARATARTATDPILDGGSLVVLAYGEPDDHLQMVATLASKLAPSSKGVTPCWDPTASWSERISAFRQLALETSHSVAIFDPDALHVAPSEEERWDDSLFLGQRSGFLEDLIEIGRVRGWTFLRPSPTVALTEHLMVRGFRHDSEPSMDAMRPLSEHLLRNSLAPEVRAMADSLLEIGALEASTLRRIIEEAESSDVGVTATEAVANLAYDALPTAARRQARNLAAMRRPALVNGKLGPFDWSGPGHVAPSNASVDSDLYALLVRRGIVRAYTSPTRARQALVPRSMRALLQRQAKVIDPDGLRSTHERMAQQIEASVEDRTDRHYHAIQAGNVEMAVDDPPYAVDLRNIAYEWSRDKRYDEAASLYKTIVQKFDDEDPYAWEYYAWNLAMHNAPDVTRSPELTKKILEAYRRAHDLDPDNPLFHGRWLGFRAELGEDVVAEFHHGLNQYTTPDRRMSVPWFVEQVIRGWRRGDGRAYDEWRAVERVSPWLMTYPRLRTLLQEAKR